MIGERAGDAAKTARVLDRLFRARGGRARAAASCAPEGVVAYAVGDIHGRTDLFDALAQALAEDVARSPARRHVIVLLGDYIDRGPDAPGVLDLAIGLAARTGAEVRALRGNHEETALAFLADAGVGRAWLAYGGGETLRAYGVAPPSPRDGAQAWEAARRAFSAALHPSHRRFLEGLELGFELGDYLFVHAGVRPGIPWREQTPRDVLWIRDAFLRHPRPSERVVVHGHTPGPAPVLGPGRIGLDTGAFATGVLSAVRLEGEARRILQVRAA